MLYILHPDGTRCSAGAAVPEVRDAWDRLAAPRLGRWADEPTDGLDHLIRPPAARYPERVRLNTVYWPTHAGAFAFVWALLGESQVNALEYGGNLGKAGATPFLGTLAVCWDDEGARPDNSGPTFVSVYRQCDAWMFMLRQQAVLVADRDLAGEVLWAVPLVDSRYFDLQTDHAFRFDPAVRPDAMRREYEREGPDNVFRTPITQAGDTADALRDPRDGKPRPDPRLAGRTSGPRGAVADCLCAYFGRRGIVLPQGWAERRGRPASGRVAQHYEEAAANLDAAMAGWLPRAADGGRARRWWGADLPRKVRAHWASRHHGDQYRDFPLGELIDLSQTGLPAGLPVWANPERYLWCGLEPAARELAAAPTNGGPVPPPPTFPNNAYPMEYVRPTAAPTTTPTTTTTPATTVASLSGTVVVTDPGPVPYPTPTPTPAPQTGKHPEWEALEKELHRITARLFGWLTRPFRLVVGGAAEPAETAFVGMYEWRTDEGETVIHGLEADTLWAGRPDREPQDDRVWLQVVGVPTTDSRWLYQTTRQRVAALRRRRDVSGALYPWQHFERLTDTDYDYGWLAVQGTDPDAVPGLPLVPGGAGTEPVPEATYPYPLYAILPATRFNRDANGEQLYLPDEPPPASSAQGGTVTAKNQRLGRGTKIVDALLVRKGDRFGPPGVWPTLESERQTSPGVLYGAPFFFQGSNQESQCLAVNVGDRLGSYANTGGVSFNYPDPPRLGYWVAGGYFVSGPAANGSLSSHALLGPTAFYVGGMSAGGGWSTAGVCWSLLNFGGENPLGTYPQAVDASAYVYNFSAGAVRAAMGFYTVSGGQLYKGLSGSYKHMGFTNGILTYGDNNPDTYDAGRY